MDVGDKKNKTYYALALKIAADFGGTIAVPVVAFVLAGRWLGSQFGHRLLFTIAGFALAALISGKIIYKKAKIYGQKYEEINKIP